MPLLPPPTRALVVGAGAVGLRTAVELLRNNIQVVLNAPVSPLHPTVCSFGSGGKWGPVHCNDPRVDQWAIETLDELWSMGMDPANDRVEILPWVHLLRDHSGPTVEEFSALDKKSLYGKPGMFTDSPKLPSWSHDARLEFQHLSTEMLAWQNIALRLRIPPLEELAAAGYPYAWTLKTPVVDAPNMLTHLLREVERHRDAIEVNVETGVYFESMDAMVEHARSQDCQALVNCTGLGASKIDGCCGDDRCSDEELLQGGRGVTLQFARNAQRRLPVREGPYGDNIHDAIIGTEDAPWSPDKNFPCYLIPRGDILILGGSFLLDDTETGIRDDERTHLLKTAERLGIDVHNNPPIGEWTGFRPYRSSSLRCELDTTSYPEFSVVHNYGHGGSGWTINTGTAKECVRLLCQ